MKNIGIPPLWEIATAINFLLYYYTIKSLVSLQIQGFFAGKNQKKRAVSSLLQPPPPFGRKPCCTRQRSKPFRSNSPFLMSKRCHAALCVFRLPLFVCPCHSLLATVPQPVENTRVKCTSKLALVFSWCLWFFHCTANDTNTLAKMNNRKQNAKGDSLHRLTKRTI